MHLIIPGSHWSVHSHGHCNLVLIWIETGLCCVAVHYCPSIQLFNNGSLSEDKWQRGRDQDYNQGGQREIYGEVDYFYSYQDVLWAGAQSICNCWEEVRCRPLSSCTAFMACLSLWWAGWRIVHVKTAWFGSIVLEFKRTHKCGHVLLAQIN